MVTLWRVMLVTVRVTFCWVGVVYTIKSATVITNFILITDSQLHVLWALYKL